MTVNRGDIAGGAARELGAGLRRLRDQAGLTTRALGDRVNASAANISNWELANRLPSEERLIRILDELRAVGDERERLLTLRRQAEGPGQLVAGQPSIGPQLTKLIEHEQVALRIVDVQPLVLPGLLQTERYARATLKGLQNIDTLVTLRMGRKEVLKRTHQPVELLAFIRSEVLTQPLISPGMMAEQLRHLTMMAELPNVTIRLVSGTIPGYTPMHAGSFILFEFLTASSVVHLEHLRSSVTLWEEDDVRRFESAVTEIDKVAMTSARSVEVIAELADGLEQTT